MSFFLVQHNILMLLAKSSSVAMQVLFYVLKQRDDLLLVQMVGTQNRAGYCDIMGFTIKAILEALP